METQFDELAADMDRWKRDSGAAHDRIDAATKRAYRTALDAEGDPAELDDPRPAAIAAMVSEAKDLLFRAHAKATAVKDERRWKLLDALQLLGDWP